MKNLRLNQLLFLAPCGKDCKRSVSQGERPDHPSRKGRR